AAEKLNRFRDAQARGDAPKPDVKIEFEGINRRSHQVTHLSDNITTVVVSPDSKLYAFVAVSDQDGRPTATLYTIPEDGTQTTTITVNRGAADDEGGGGGFGGRQIGSIKFSKDGRSIFFLGAQGLYNVEIPQSALSSAGGRAGTGAAGAGPTAGGGRS